MYAGEETLFSVVADRATTLELCARSVMEVWREAVIQDAETADVFRDFAKVPFSRLKEMMIYRDENARRSWEALGADEANRNSMAHFIFSGTHLVLVLDDSTSEESRSIISAVRSINEDVLAQVSFSSARGEAA